MTDEMLACAMHVTAAFRLAARDRHRRNDWVNNERNAIVDAANQWALRHGRPTITIADLLAVEPRAVGHVAYAEKIGLYAAELVYRRRP